MRIGRNLTVQEVNNIVNEYNQTYELTETQINTIIQNVDGAVGCLALLTGITEKHIPYTRLGQSSQTIGHNTYVTMSWEDVSYDQIGCFNPASPTLITPAYSGVYLVALSFDWSSNSVGYRLGCLHHGVGYSIYDRYAPCSGDRTKHVLTQPVYLIGNHDYTVGVEQSSGGNLTLYYSWIDIYRLGVEAL